ncbi:MAG: hypothetical protein WC375_13015 [Methanomassiliicoccales archaeon]
MHGVEIIEVGGNPLCYIVRGSLAPQQTTFITPPEFKQQVGFVAYPAGSEIPRHSHLPLERHLVGTAEVLVVRQGRCLLDVYDEDRRLVATREVAANDVVLLIDGGHGFRMLEDTLFLELKQGPYLGINEKERF